MDENNTLKKGWCNVTSNSTERELLASAIVLLEQYRDKLNEMLAHRNAWREWAMDWHGEYSNMTPPPDRTLRWE